jgi:hypothetical protein
LPGVVQETGDRGFAQNNHPHNAVKLGVCLEGALGKPPGGVRPVPEDHAQVGQLLAEAASQRSWVKHFGGQLLIGGLVCREHLDTVKNVLLQRSVALATVIQLGPRRVQRRVDCTPCT